MGDKPKSKTESVPPSFSDGLFSALTGWDANDSYKTTITDDDGTKYEGAGYTSEESQKSASDKYERSKK